MSDNLVEDLHRIEVWAANVAQGMQPQTAERALDALQTLREALPTFKDALQVAAAELTTSEEGRTLLQCFLETKQKRRRISREMTANAEVRAWG